MGGTRGMRGREERCIQHFVVVGKPKQMRTKNFSIAPRAIVGGADFEAVYKICLI